jgi:hypothetical protein
MLVCSGFLFCSGVRQGALLRKMQMKNEHEEDLEDSGRNKAMFK